MLSKNEDGLKAFSDSTRQLGTRKSVFYSNAISCELNPIFKVLGQIMNYILEKYVEI